MLSLGLALLAFDLCCSLLSSGHRSPVWEVSLGVMPSLCHLPAATSVHLDPLGLASSSRGGPGSGHQRACPSAWGLEAASASGSQPGLATPGRGCSWLWACLGPACPVSAVLAGSRPCWNAGTGHGAAWCLAACEELWCKTGCSCCSMAVAWKGQPLEPWSATCRSLAGLSQLLLATLPGLYPRQRGSLAAALG